MLIFAVSVALVANGCGGGDATGETGSTTTEAQTGGTGLSGINGIEPVDELRGAEPSVKPPKHLPKNIVSREIRPGTGREAKTGDLVTIQFNAVFFNGEHFESSWEFENAFKFKLGADKVSPGWEKGIPGMKEGGRYYLIVPWTQISRFGIPPGAGPGQSEIYVLDLLEVS